MERQTIPNATHNYIICYAEEDLDNPLKFKECTKVEMENWKYQAENIKKIVDKGVLRGKQEPYMKLVGKQDRDRQWPESVGMLLSKTKTGKLYQTTATVGQTGMGYPIFVSCAHCFMDMITQTEYSDQWFLQGLDGSVKDHKGKIWQVSETMCNYQAKEGFDFGFGKFNLVRGEGTGPLTLRMAPMVEYKHIKKILNEFKPPLRIVGYPAWGQGQLYQVAIELQYIHVNEDGWTFLVYSAIGGNDFVDIPGLDGGQILMDKQDYNFKSTNIAKKDRTYANYDWDNVTETKLGRHCGTFYKKGQKNMGFGILRSNALNEWILESEEVFDKASEANKEMLYSDYK